MKKLSLVPLGIITVVALYLGPKATSNQQENIDIPQQPGGSEQPCSDRSPCSRKPSFMTYDPKHVEKLLAIGTPLDAQGNQYPIIKIGELKDPVVKLYHFAEWNDPGDFMKIQIQLGKHGILELENGEGWIKVLEKSELCTTAIADSLVVPEHSPKVQLHPYCATLDTGAGRKILMLFGYPYSTGPPLLTLIAVDEEHAELIFNKEVHLKEIRETEQGYRLIGTQGSSGYWNTPCEVLIEANTLTFLSCRSAQPPSFQQVYEGQDPPIVLYNAAHWGTNKQPGEFTRIRIAGTTEDIQKLDTYGVWTKVDENVKLPAHSSTIKKHPYYLVLNAEAASPTLALFGRSYAGNGPNSLTLLSVCQSGIYPHSSSYFILHEVIETDQDYRLVGTRMSATGEKEHYERLITKYN